MHILDAVRTAHAMPYSQLVPALAQAVHDFSEGRIQSPERMVVPIDASNVLLCMPAVGHDLGVTKLITIHPDNMQHGLPVIQGEVLVFEVGSGRRLALLDGPTTTARRTAAMTLLGIQTLAPIKPSSVLLIGAGVQAAAHADALAEFFGVTQFWVAARDLRRTQIFCNELSSRFPHVVASPLAMEAIQSDLPHTDVIIALTTSRVAVIPERIATDTLAIGVGAFKPDMVEFPAALLRERIIVVDDLPGAHHEAGDLIQAGVDWNQVHSINDILSGQVAGAVSLHSPLPVFKTVGQAAWDLAAARVARQFLQD